MYKSDDKIVVKIDKLDAASLNKEDNVAFYNEQVLGKLSKFTKSERIKFSEEEMEEFNDIRSRANELLKALMVIMKSCTYYPHLKRWILEEDHPLPRNEREILFAKVWENPELIEVVKERKYYIKILGQYLVRNSNESEGIELVSKRNADTFTPKRNSRNGVIGKSFKQST
ncbi:MAG: hypothetical protein LKI22_03310 [Liquorilactobacillus nagelii]|jgi:hypothetical protein|uniref:hypothetical protein n=1 Tax=Liquorilactobacillus nagelii TaxID=82688 RepID=UPI00242EB907|nr:hypothetical protein [Liquorilactobacillus nagelii]MCI1632966.1 hypothetical protein [Liquorilactobacillus nagelii]